MKRGAVIALMLIILVISTVSYFTFKNITGKVIFTPTIPTSFSDTEIRAMWDSIFQESSSGITIIKNTSNSDNYTLAYSYKVNSNLTYFLTSAHSNNGSFAITATYMNIINDTLRTQLINVTADQLTVGIVMFPIVASAPGNLVNYQLRNINITQADFEFKSIFKVIPSTWGAQSEQDTLEYNFSEASTNKKQSGLVLANYILDLFMFESKNISSCTPSWTAHNTTCSSNDKLTQYFTDSNSCNQPMSNLTFTCDYDGNGLMGILNTSANFSAYINDSDNLTRTFTGVQKVQFKLGYNLIEFSWNFSQTLDLSKIYIEKQSSSASLGYLLIKGISASKKIQADRLTNTTKICARNAELQSISELSQNCTGNSEILLDCPATVSGISCTINSSYFTITGLTSSAARETVLQTSQANCTPRWNCTIWGSCVSSLQTRTCTDLNFCNTTSGRILNQSCTQIIACTPSWLCGNWTACSKEGIQTRVCNDKNSCNLTINSKTETITCNYKKSNLGLIIIISVILILIIAVIIILIYILNKKQDKISNAPTILYTQPFSQQKNYL